jgi:hypothetical protein
LFKIVSLENRVDGLGWVVQTVFLSKRIFEKLERKFHVFESSLKMVAVIEVHRFHLLKKHFVSLFFFFQTKHQFEDDAPDVH